MLTAKIDWLEFTLLQTQLFDVLKLLKFKYEDFSPLSKGKFGYHNQVKWTGGHIYIMFTAKDSDIFDIKTKINLKSGVHVMITGQGCRQYSVNHDLLELISSLSARDKVNFSRIDLAIDDLESKILNYTRINQAALNGFFTSRWSKWDEINSRQTSDNSFKGRTMYFGSQASDLYCRIYDKTLERKANANENVDSEWTRLEIVYRKDRARKLVGYLIKDGISIGDILKGTLKQYLRFLQKPANSKDKTKARWPSASWWDDLLAGVSKLSLTIEKEPKTIEDMTAWVEQQISPTIAAILKAHEGDMAWLRSILYKGSKRLSQKHKDAISQHLKGITT